MHIAMVSGSNRKDASSTKMLRYMKRKLQEQGYAVTLVDIYETPLPMYAPDEDGVHPNAARMIAAVREADGLVFATPEYHGSVSGALKNALDYLSADEVRGKPVLSVSSAGGAVGVSSLTQLQAIIRGLHGINSPEWVSIGGGHRFEGDAPADEAMRKRVGRALDTFLKLTAALKAVTATC
ncbi:NADPH-dependent FMN reductase [Paenibacillus sp.]|uniref:NADPH-dependent FMN reductase n=1 Tax=Paenibacillus sp. TaxID=58172 RepID=UPI002D2E59D4|nr:NADPH-dependent FMN reductase [Paenibacillus sp.]HZG83431.1 NADPH-dependent FMN reductase [Paenibacillus sp.]